MNEKIKFQIVLFFFYFSLLALFINSANGPSYPVSHMGIEALAERGTFYTEGSKLSRFQPIYAWWSDQFQFNGHGYTNKQPGLFFIGAIPYFFLHKLGITYLNNYDFTGACVALFSSSLFSALMMLLIFNIAFFIINKKLSALIISIVFGFGTVVFPYAGMVHHDIFASFFLLLGFFIAFYKFKVNKNLNNYYLLLSGFLSAFSLFISYNSIASIISIGIYVFLNKERTLTKLFFIGLYFGLMVSFLFNQIVFGGIFNFSTLLSQHLAVSKDVVPYAFSFSNFINKLYIYFISPLSSITFYMPILYMGLIGFMFFPNKYNSEKKILPIFFLLQFIQLSTIKANGWCQYGPRYFLEAIPFTCIGFSGLFIPQLNKSKNLLRQNLKKIFYFLAITSILIVITGSVYGVIYCDYINNGFLKYIVDSYKTPFPKFYFFQYALIFLAPSIYFLKKKYKLIPTVKFNFTTIVKIIILLIAIVYIWMLSNSTWNIFIPSYLGGIFDSLGANILKGSFEVDENKLQWEVFNVHGKKFTFFGLWGALIRIFLNFLCPYNIERWANLSCLIASLLLLIAFYKIIKLGLSLNNNISILQKKVLTTSLIIFFGIGSPLFYLMNAGEIYHEAILWGFCFSLWTIYLIFQFINSPSDKNLFFIFLFSGLSLHAKVSFGIPLILISAFLFFQNIKNKKIFLLVFPLVVLLLLQSFYNYKRFGSITKFIDCNYYHIVQNNKFELNMVNKYGLTNIKRIPLNFSAFFIPDKCNFRKLPPYFLICTPSDYKNVINNHKGTLPLLISCPWILFIFVLGMLILLKNKISITIKVVAAMLSLEALLILCFISLDYRYISEFFPLFIFILGLFLSKFNFLLPSNKNKLKIIIILGVFSIITNVFSTLGLVHSRSHNENQKKTIQSFFMFFS